MKKVEEKPPLSLTEMITANPQNPTLMETIETSKRMGLIGDHRTKSNDPLYRTQITEKSPKEHLGTDVGVNILDLLPEEDY